MSFNLGDIFVTFKASTENLDKAMRSVQKKLDDSGKSADNMNGKFGKMGVVIGAIAGIVQSVFLKAMTVISNTIGDAIKRVDTLNNSKRTFENMGFAADDSKNAVKDLDKSIRGLPTSLDDAVRGMTLISASTNDIKGAQKIYSALNDAVLGFGGTSDMASNATVQLSQDLAGGVIHAQTWLSMLNSGLGPALNAIARDMGITTTKLRDGLSDGSISAKKFTDALVKLDQKGGGGMKSLHKIALDSSAGINTGMANAQTAIARGIATIIDAIGSKNIANAISTTGKAFEQFFSAVAVGIKFVAQYKDVFVSLAVIIGALLLPKIILMTAMTVLAGISSLVAGAQMFAGWLMALGPIGLLIAAIIAVVAVIVHNWGKIQPFVMGLVRAISKGFKGFVDGLVGWFRDAGRNIHNFIDGVVGWFRDMPKNIAKALGGLVNLILAPYKMAFNFIADAWNNTVGKLSWKVPSWVPGIGGNTIGAPHLPHFATGVENFAGGWAVVGERGPELAYLPKGSSVLSNEQSKGMGGGGTTIRIGTVNNASDEEYIMRRIDFNQRHISRGGSPA